MMHRGTLVGLKAGMAKKVENGRVVVAAEGAATVRSPKARGMMVSRGTLDGLKVGSAGREIVRDRVVASTSDAAKGSATVPSPESRGTLRRGTLVGLKDEFAKKVGRGRDVATLTSPEARGTSRRGTLVGLKVKSGSVECGRAGSGDEDDGNVRGGRPTESRGTQTSARPSGSWPEVVGRRWRPEVGRYVSSGTWLWQRFVLDEP